ncbi:CreA family protein [bacterium]|nr:CreA family protein [bacterium]
MGKILCMFSLLFSAYVFAWDIGSVDTTFRFTGPNDKIIVQGFYDPDIGGITCHMSHAQAGGLTGAVGLAEDPSNASIACRQTAPIGNICQGQVDSATPPGGCLDVSRQKEVFSQKTSPLFKELHVVRMYDPNVHALIYLVYSDKIIEGSPKNSISTVPLFAASGE